MGTRLCDDQEKIMNNLKVNVASYQIQFKTGDEPSRLALHSPTSAVGNAFT